MTDFGHATHGNGAMINVRNASRDVAHGYPSLLYICTPNSGKPAAKEDRAKELAASAEAAYNGYASFLLLAESLGRMYTTDRRGM